MGGHISSSGAGGTLEEKVTIMNGKNTGAATFFIRRIGLRSSRDGKELIDSEEGRI